MIDLKDTTFIITLNLESVDRIRNAYVVLNYMISNFNTNIIVKEVDTHSKFESEILSRLKINNDSNLIKNIKHVFDEIPDNGIFHKSKYVNDMADMVTTEVVCTYDIDVILPEDSYIKGQEMCKGDYDMVFPFEIGDNQIMIYLDSVDNLINQQNSIVKFKNLLDISFYNRIWKSTYGHVQFYKNESFRKGFMMNENFSSYSPEDIEIGTRFDVLGYRVGRIDNKIIHIEHSRGINSSENTPCAQSNNYIWNMLSRFNKEEMIEYYSNQEYYKNRINNYVGIK
jgi:hypothetical protein